MLTRLEEDYLGVADFPYTDKQPIHFGLVSDPVQLKKSELEQAQLRYQKLLCPEPISVGRIMQRIVPKIPADLTGIRTWESMNFEPHFETGPGGAGARDIERIIGAAQRAQDYRTVVRFCSAILYKQSKYLCWTHIIGYISGVITEVPQPELFFSCLCKAMVFNLIELPHLFHFLDELRIVSETGDCESCTLLKLNKFSDRAIINAFYKHAHIIPELTTRPQTSTALSTNEVSRLKAPGTNVPPLVPVGEGEKEGGGSRHFSDRAFERQAKLKNKETDVIDMMKSRKWVPACTLATAHLRKNPNDADMYLNRAMCLVNIEKYSDAILDCTRALNVQKSDRALRLRAGIWLMLGDKLMAQEDLDAMEDKSLSGPELGRLLREAECSSRLADDVAALSKSRKNE